MNSSYPYFNLTGLEDKLDVEIKQQNRDRRERIATAAMQGMLASGSKLNERCDILAINAIDYADALIAGLDKEPQQ